MTDEWETRGMVSRRLSTHRLALRQVPFQRSDERLHRHIAAHLHPKVFAQLLSLLQENGHFFEFSLCLSRACLCKMIVLTPALMYKWLKNAVFRRVSSSQDWPRGSSPSPLRRLCLVLATACQPVRSSLYSTFVSSERNTADPSPKGLNHGGTQRRPRSRHVFTRVPSAVDNLRLQPHAAHPAHAARLAHAARPARAARSPARASRIPRNAAGTFPPDGWANTACSW